MKEVAVVCAHKVHNQSVLRTIRTMAAIRSQGIAVHVSNQGLVLDHTETVQDSELKLEDTGLQGGAACLRDQQLLLDYTLIVEGQAFRVHKFVLASVSDLFRAMLCGPMSESMSDTVQLSEVSAQQMSQLIDFIYTGHPCYINNNTKRMLELAAFFQMPMVIEKCCQHLMNLLSVQTCIDLLTTFKTYSMDKEAVKVTEFVKDHLLQVIQHCKMHEITPDTMNIILDNWKKDDWDVFKYLHSWISADFDNRKEHTNDFMSQLNFNTMSPQQIKNIREMEIFTRSEGEWRQLVETASGYHQQTSLQKVADDSEQRMSRFGKSAFLFTKEGGYRGEKIEFSVHRLVQNEKKASKWERCNSIEFPQVTGKISHVIEVNNYLITCSEFGENQTWQVFDPLSLTWTKMPKMPKPKDAFAMVYHEKKLCVLGGCIGSGSQTCVIDTIDEYSFQADCWTSTKKLPLAVKNHSACVLDGAIYVSGGETASHSTDRLDCLSTLTETWESKAPMYKAVSKHKMCVMTIRRQEVIIVIDKHLEVHCYYPGTDQWSSCYVQEQYIDKCSDGYDQPYKDIRNLKWHPDSMILVDGNTIYLLRMYGEAYKEIMYDWEETDSPPRMVDAEFLCVKWRVSDESNDDVQEMTEGGQQIRITQFGMEDFTNFSRNTVGGVLAFSANIRREYRWRHPWYSN